MANKLSLEDSLVSGSNGNLTIDTTVTSKPLVLRGVIKKDHANECRRIGRDYWYIDTGYFGNFPSVGNANGKKIWHRVVKNENQHSTIRDVPADRWGRLVGQDPRLLWKGWKNYDKKILLVMPNPKACKWYNIDYDEWVETTQKNIAKYTDLPVEVRVKGSRNYRNKEYSIYDAFDSGVACTVTMNSMAALESILYGIPAIVSVPCAAGPLASTDISTINNPFKPEVADIEKQCHNLAYGQFTLHEIEDGTAYNITKSYP